MSDAELKRLGYHVADALLSSTHGRQVLREMVLCVLAEREAMSEDRVVSAFLEVCASRGLEVRLSQERQIEFLPLRPTAKAEASLRAVATIYRPQIVQRLERIEELQRNAARVRILSESTPPKFPNQSKVNTA